MKAVLLHCVVTPVFVLLDEEGRPQGTGSTDQPWTLLYKDLGTLRDLVDAAEAQAQAQASEPDGE